MRVHHRPRVSHKVITRQKALFISDNSLYLENLGGLTTRLLITWSALPA
ncbi:unannotated protein [freshwater metagenome]|uniref:Unannotated protein n=1 Tax=freshwater metagenome TaxID=449393 RepID=A0A6J7TUW5_9ZZZZ